MENLSELLNKFLNRAFFVESTSFQRRAACYYGYSHSTSVLNNPVSQDRQSVSPIADSDISDPCR